MVDKVEEYFIGMWACRGYTNLYPNTVLEKNGEQNAFFQAMLEIDISTNEFYAPIGLGEAVLTAKIRGNDRLVFPMTIQPDTSGKINACKKTSNSIFYQFSRWPRIGKLVTGKGNLYYGGKNMIFNENYEPLIISVVKFHFDEKGAASITNPKCIISYKVFENGSNIIENNIIKKAIPTFIKYPIKTSIGYTIRTAGFEQPSIEICDTSNMVIKPCTPTIDIIKDFKETLLNNL